MLAKDARDKYRKNCKNNKCYKTQDLEEVGGKKGPEMSADIANIAKRTRIFLLAKDACDKYRKNRKNNKCNKTQYLEEDEGKKDPEMSANVAKVTRIFLAS